MLINKKNIKAIIFDFDDTLVDEMYWAKDKWKKTISFVEEKIGIKNFGKHFWKVFKEKGPKYKYHVNDTLKQLNQSQTLVKPIVDYFLSQVGDEHLYNGVIDCLNFLKDKFKLGLITNGKKESHDSRIKNAKIYNFFDTIIYTYGEPKPALKPFIECIDKLNVSKEETIFIGNDPEADILGAKRMGMITVFFNPRNITKSKDADVHIKSYNELINFLKN